MGMAWRPGEELAPRGRTGYSDAELMKAEEELLPALSEPRRHGRPPGVSALPRDPHHPTTLRPLPPPPPPPPPPPRRPPPTPHTLPSCSGEPLLSIRHFRAQVARRRLVERRSPFWVRANCLFSVFVKCGLGTFSLPARPSEAAPPGHGSELLSALYFTVEPGSGLSFALE
ncbi:proline-rich protein 11-like isoform X1 [Apodemus sylvaticus]|uniref:proline-rich protein 11-like isoform X1 n=1 Tax=Apodemus sylvaticus TaxID=10129 RepID=UPI002242A798|nr:proline-rich protein 11-like isoform X1 [Apodemus sylvaticus]